MPTHRGIKLRLISQREFGIHPEFVHPESTQFTNRSPDLRVLPSPATDESKADQVLGRPSVISVYVPSVPGSRFWLHFSIDDEAAGRSQWYYFKLFMNGRNIASWGTNSKTDPAGQIMRGLFEPGPRWNYKVDSVVYKNMGIETRPFFFSNELELQSAAEDGGLIEVLVHRARGRKRKMPEPPDFKDQEPYGVVMPSSGLFDKPQDAKYYDWHLKDPKDKPFATFKFHYRSWDSLVSLHLIPSTFPQRMIPPSPSILSLNGLSHELQDLLAESGSEGDAGSPLKCSESSCSDTPWISDVFDVPDEVAQDKEKREAFIVPPNSSPCFPVRKDSILDSKIARAKIEKPTSPTSNSSWKGYLDRPLPDIPVRESSLKHSRKSSSLSNAPSITPSLLPYMERDTLSPEPEIGVASVIAVTRRASPVQDQQANLIQASSHQKLVPSDYDSDSDFGTPSQNPIPPRTSSKSIKRHGIAPPPLYTLPNITIRKTRRSPVKVASKTPPKNYSPALQDDSLPSTQFDNSASFLLTEAEWMYRTPSPAKHHPALTAEIDPGRAPVTAKKPYAVGNGSIRGNKVKKEKTADDKGSLRKKARGWYDRMKGSDESNTLNDTFNDSDGSKVKLTGNWI